MSASTHDTAGSSRQSGSVRLGGLVTNPTFRSIATQVLLVLGLAIFVWWVVDNTSRNLAQANIASGFGFLDSRAGFDIGQTPIAYSSNDTYGRAILVGLVNTVIVAFAGIVLATIVGFIVGIGRLSRNYLVRLLSTVYVEVFRNIPTLLVILFWYFGVLSVLSGPRGVEENAFGLYLTNRGLQGPTVVFEPLAWMTLAALCVGLVAAVALAVRNRSVQRRTGRQRPLLLPALGLVFGLPLVVFVVTGLPATFDVPTATRFNLTGGFHAPPEFIALWLALGLYTAAFIAEIVRAGILAVSKGQTEAASALGLRGGQTLRLVVVPQAMRVMIPPVTSQYLNLTKNTSLGLAIGYPELFSVGSTVLNQSGQSIEVVVVWISIYLSLSIMTAILMNWFNARMALVER